MTLLDRLTDTGPAMRLSASHPGFARVAIIDIGSNSVRLVVYDGPRRSPFVLFNEKVMAGLGAELASSGRLGAAAIARTLAALARFRRLCDDMEVRDVRCVATAAVRDASNAEELIAPIEAIGFQLRILSGQEEAHASAYGVLSGIPDADGVMGDLGGGSLELARIAGGRILHSVSLPLGVLRIRPLRGRGKDQLGKKLAAMLTQAGWEGAPAGLPFYMVGGSWRALARLDMHALNYPLPIFQNYRMSPQRVPAVARMAESLDRSALKSIPSLSGARLPTLPDAAALLAELAARLKSSELVVSSHGLREGLLFQDLEPAVAAEDPLLVAARTEGDAQGRFAGHGDLIHSWIAPLFGEDGPALQRIRHAACLLADVGWRANPDFRAERGLETGLHGNWVAIAPEERAMLGQALYTSLGGGDAPTAMLRRLATADQLQRASQWGLAIRFAQRLSGGVALALENCRVRVTEGTILVQPRQGYESLYGEAAERRLKQLAQSMGLNWQVSA